MALAGAVALGAVLLGDGPVLGLLLTVGLRRTVGRIRSGAVDRTAGLADGTVDAVELDRLAAVYGAVAGAEGDGGPPVPGVDGTAAREGRAPRGDTAPVRSAVLDARGACGVHDTVPPPMGGSAGYTVASSGWSGGAGDGPNDARDTPPAAEASSTPAMARRFHGVRRWRAAVGRLIRPR